MIVGRCEWGALSPPPSHGAAWPRVQANGAHARAPPHGRLLGWSAGQEDGKRMEMAHLGFVPQAIASVDPDVSACTVSIASQLVGGAWHLLCEHATLLVEACQC